MMRPPASSGIKKRSQKPQLTPTPTANIWVTWPAWDSKALAVRPPWWRKAKETEVGNGSRPDEQQSLIHGPTCPDHPKIKVKV